MYGKPTVIEKDRYSSNDLMTSKQGYTGTTGQLGQGTSCRLKRRRRKRRKDVVFHLTHRKRAAYIISSAHAISGDATWDWSKLTLPDLYKRKRVP